jgi:hypothetical protein
VRMLPATPQNAVRQQQDRRRKGYEPAHPSRPWRLPTHIIIFIGAFVNPNHEKGRAKTNRLQ